MASNSEAPDDLIAELARLMADEGKSEPKPQAPSERAPGLRLPGDAPAPAAPRQEGVLPKFDLSSLQMARPAAATSAPVSPVVASPAPAVRIPGAETAPVVAEPAPFRFDFDSNITRKPAGPVSGIPERVQPVVATPSPVPAEPMVRKPEPVIHEPADDVGALDQDSLADLIAAELANELVPEEQVQEAAPAPALSTAPPRGEDSFGIPPVFGLGTKPVQHEPRLEPSPAAEPVRIEPALSHEPKPAQTADAKPVQSGSDDFDSLTDIERLVGPAINVGETEQPAPTRSRATPVLLDPAMAKEPSARKRPFSRRQRSDLDAVDDAIMAAAAATGAQVDWVDDGTPNAPQAAEKRHMRGAPTPFFGLTRAVAGPLVAVGLLVVTGFGLYWVLGQGSAPTGPAPLIVADTAAIKETPAPVEAEQTQSVVFNEISGVDTGAQEQIVSRDQTEQESVSEIASTGTASSDPTSGVTDPNQDGLVNRKVRTVTVRPDGTIVAGDDSVAGATMLPVDRPNVPDVPGADFSTPDLIANAAAEAEASAAAPAATATPTIPLVQAGANVPVADATGAVLPGRSVTIPLTRPGNLQAPVASALAAPAATTPVAPVAETPAQQPAQTATTSPVTNAAAYVQLSSQRSEEAARESAQQIATRYGPLFGGANLEVQRVDLGDRGIYYRVLVPADSRATAANICTNLKAAGGDCFVL